MIPIHGWLVPRIVADRAGKWDERISLHDDGEYFCRVILNSAGIRFCPEARVYYRQVPGSLSRCRSRTAAESYLAVCDSYRAVMGEIQDSGRSRAALAINYSRFLYETHPKYPDLLDRALDCLRELGFDEPPVVGGKRFKWMACRIGMKRALRARAWLRRSGV